MSVPGASENGDEAFDTLVPRIRAKRDDVQAYLRATRARRHRLVQTTIIAGAVAATLTAVPALGGEPLADWMTEAFALPAPSWRFLCAVAALCSFAATVATQMLKSHNYEERIVAAQGAQATLELLEIGIETGHVDGREATDQYAQTVKSTAFIDSSHER